jgi:hypothetical protein
MNPKVLLRIAAILMLFHAIGHTIGASTWKKTSDVAKQTVIASMTSQKFPFMGVDRSMAEYYDGFSIAVTLALLLITAMLWISSNVAPHSIALVKNILVVLSIILLAWGIDEMIFFFPFAAAFSLLAFLLTLIATLRLMKPATVKTRNS